MSGHRTAGTSHTHTTGCRGQRWRGGGEKPSRASTGNPWTSPSHISGRFLKEAAWRLLQSQAHRDSHRYACYVYS
uniref:Uncharacterized protein n=1 Tax=Oryza punctata TaxID=4537 RepID=A0A0E0JGQ3_ORYPU